MATTRTMTRGSVSDVPGYDDWDGWMARNPDTVEESLRETLAEGGSIRALASEMVEIARGDSVRLLHSEAIAWARRYAAEELDDDG